MNTSSEFKDSGSRLDYLERAYATACQERRELQSEVARLREPLAATEAERDELSDEVDFLRDSKRIWEDRARAMEAEVARLREELAFAKQDFCEIHRVAAEQEEFIEQARAVARDYHYRRRSWSIEAMPWLEEPARYDHPQDAHQDEAG